MIILKSMIDGLKLIIFKVIKMSYFEEFMQILRENIKPINIERQVKIVFNKFIKDKQLTIEQANELEEQVRTLLKF